ncbi:hypothetical protein AgCh_009491 [Apium graveolens]
MKASNESGEARRDPQQTQLGGFMTSTGSGADASTTSMVLDLLKSKGQDPALLAQSREFFKNGFGFPLSPLMCSVKPCFYQVHEVGAGFAMISGTSMDAPHIAGIAALVKQEHFHESRASIKSALMTTLITLDRAGTPLQAQQYSGSETVSLVPATPFDYGSGHVNPRAPLDPGLILDAAVTTIYLLMNAYMSSSRQLLAGSGLSFGM